ncbi:hypothetical protein [Pseudomonas aeruginosa]|uniref:hypothetical protein n=1 Tax=Pseudomonas aeruginosa TaxID=287 RepID=UPI000AAA96CE|nr:hypothetical protein [Pseudomonas aeruginosa]
MAYRFSKLPTGWTRTTGCDLGAFKAGGQAGTSIAALKCLLAVSLQADFHTRTAAVSYNDFELLTGLSRPMISKGLRMLADMQILTIAGDHAHRYTVNEVGDNYWVRIPRHLDTQPALIWTLVPRALGHLIHVHLDRQSERSDAGLHC